MEKEILRNENDLRTDPVGTYDYDDAVVAMMAVDVALCHYFQDSDWLTVRDFLSGYVPPELRN